MKNVLLRRTILFALLLIPILSFSKVVYVTPTGAGNQDGSSWANATTIYDAIGSASWAKAMWGDQVWLKQGTYTIGHQLGLQPRCSVYGGFVGNETDLSQRATDPALTVVQTGIWILGQISGGTLESLTFLNSGVITDYAATINNCVFDNSMLGGENSSGNTTYVNNCTLKNSPDYAVYIWPGGVIRFSDCEFYNNKNAVTALSSGQYFAQAHFSRCVFRDNGGGERGGAVYISGYSDIFNCLFYNNTATVEGGAIYAYNTSDGGRTLVFNCTITNNTAPYGSGISIDNKGNTASEVINSIVWGNNGNNSISSCTNCAGSPYDLVFRNNIIQGGPPVASFILSEGNVDVNPLFTADYKLRSCSPAINAGNNGFNPGNPDLAGNNRHISVIDQGCYEFQLPKFSASTNPSGNASFCGGGGNITASDGASFLWSTGATTKTINVTQAGNYSVTVTNHDGCVAVSPVVNITLSDINAPVISNCPANIVVSPSAGQCSAVVSWTAPTATDNCAVTGFTSTHAPGATFGPGTTTVTYTATDALNNTSTCSFTVRVIDDVPPNHNASATGSVTISSGGSTSGWTPMVRHFQDPLPVGAKITGLTLVYTAVDHGYGGSGANSEIYIAGNYIGFGQLFHHSQTFTLNYTGNLPGYVYGGTNPLQMNFVGYPGWQANWQGGTITFNYTYNSTPGNSITRNLGPSGSVTISAADIDPGLTDNCGIASRTLSKTTYTCSDVGTNPVTLTVTDHDGNTATAIGSVTIVNPVVPTISCPADITVDAGAGLCTAIINVGTATATGACLGAVTGVRSDGQPLTAPYAKGTTTITWSVTSTNGQTVSCVQQITVNDNQPPVFSNTTTTVGVVSVNVNSHTWMDATSWTLRDKFNNVVLSGSGYGHGGNHTSGNTNGANGPFTFFIEANGPPNDNYANWSVRCNGVAVASGCIRGSSGPSCGNTGSTTRTVAVCATTTTVSGCTITDINLNAAPGACTAVANWTIPTAVDNCAGVTVTSNYNPGSSFPIGTTNVIYNATDASGNSATCSFKVIVTDNQNPTISCPANIVTTAAADACGAVVNYTVNYGDNCTGAVLEQTAGLASGSLFPPGVTTNSFKVTDASGRTTTCSFTVTVTDNIAPVITGCPSDISLNTATGACATIVNWAAPSASDNCQVTSFTSTHNPGSSFNKGTTTVTYTVKDAAGNTTTCSFTVTVTDNEAPAISCSSAQVVNLDANCSAILPDYRSMLNATDNCGTITITQTPAPGTPLSGTGTIPVSILVTDASGNITPCSFIVTVQDITAPVINCVSPIAVNNDPGTCGAVVTYAVTSSDGCAGHTLVQTSGLPGGSVFPVGVTTNTFIATDASGNATECSFTVTVTDNESPVLYGVPADATVQCDEVPPLPVVTASDNCDPNPNLIFNTFTIPGNCPGNYAIIRHWMVADNKGNLSFKSQLLTVIDTKAPVIQIAASGAQVQCDGNGNTAALQTWLANNGGATATDACSGVTWSHNYTSLSDGCGATGSATVTFTATDACGNSSSTTATFNITDDIAPAITAASDMTVACDGSGNISQLQAWLNNHGGATASDVCSSITWTHNYISLSDGCGATGSATVTFTATDACGNSSSTTATFSITDDIAPAITAASDMTVACDGSGNISQLQAWLNNHGGATASDVCSGITWTHNYTSLSDGCGATGSATVTFTAADACGNSSSTTATFSITDHTAPAITAAADITVACDGNGNTSQLQAWLDNHGGATANDACSGVTWSHNYTSLSDDCGATGSATVIFTATDACGNSSSTMATFTIADTQAPVFTSVPAAITISCTADVPAALTGNATAQDACGSVSMMVADVVSDQTAINRFTITRTWTATDECGNSSNASQVITVNDNSAPVFTNVTSSVFRCFEDNINGNYSIPAVSGTDVCSGGVTFSYTVSGATVRSGNGNDASGQFNTGTSTITWTLIDASGNSSTAITTVEINPSVQVTIPSVTVLPQGTQPNTIYYGYAPASVLTMNALASGGTAPYTYNWSTSASALLVTTPNASQVTLLSAIAGIYTVSVEITDSKGCTATFSRMITVIDVRCGAALDKVLLCRTDPDAPQPGNSNNPKKPKPPKAPKDNCVPANVVATMLSNGASLGDCVAPVAKNSEPAETEKQAVQVNLYPNPSTGIFQLQLVNYDPGKVNVSIISISGKTITSKLINITHRNETTTFNISNHASGTYLVRVVSESSIQSARVIIAR